MSFFSSLNKILSYSKPKYHTMPELTFIKKTVSQATLESEAISLTSNDQSDDVYSSEILPHLLNSYTVKDTDIVLKNLHNKKNSSSNSSIVSESSSNQSKKLPILEKKNLVLAFGSLGVIYGDIGTSPLYVYSTIFSDFEPSDKDIMGAMSCIFWLFTIVVIVKYAFIVLTLGPFKREGGQIALYVKLIRYLRINKYKRVNGITEDDYDEVESDNDSTYSCNLEKSNSSDNKDLDQCSSNLNINSASSAQGSMSSKISRKSIHDDGVLDFDSASIKSNRFYYKQNFIHKGLSHYLTFSCFLGCSLVFSDGLLTPTTSVLSAIGGITAPVPSLSNYVMPISIVILLLLFAMQRFGSGKVSFVFAPIILIWMLTILTIGIINIVKYDHSVFKSLNPVYAVKFLHKRNVFVLGSVLLSITGCEAMFADVGHFNKISIQMTLVGFVYPCLMICYLGQTAFLLHHRSPNDIKNVFYACIPGGNKSNNGLYWFVFVIATFSTIIASQALILSVFSILKQLIKLKYFPNLRIVQTSKEHKGQIYIPIANWILMVAVCLTTVGFRNSNNVTAAYGTGISLDFCVTTSLIGFCIIYIYNLHFMWSVAMIMLFGSLDLTLVIASMKKIPKGAWFPLIVCTISVSFLYVYNNKIGKQEQKVREIISNQINSNSEDAIQHNNLSVDNLSIEKAATVDEMLLTWAQQKSKTMHKILSWLI